MATRRTQVVIAGAGPVGGVAALILAAYGIDVMVFEAGAAVAADLRASTFHPPTIEMLDTLGLAAPLLAQGLKAPVYHWRERATGEVFAFDFGELADRTRYPFRIQCEQFQLARWLAERIDAAPTAQLHFGHRVSGYAQDDRGVRVAVEGPDGPFEVAADFLIGADGAGSAVRKVMGIGFEGFTYAEKFLCLTTDEPLESHLPGLAHVNYVSDPEEWAVLLRVPSLWRVLVPAGETDADDWLLSDAKKSALFDGLIGKPEVATAHRTIYRVQQRVAERFVDGRVAIIGDAAHLNSPLGGFGMNSGIHDAFNLCERLAAVLRGAPRKPALAAFERERRSITLAFVQAQTIANMEMIGAGSAAAHALRRARMARLMADASARRAFLLRQSMLDTGLAA